MVKTAKIETTREVLSSLEEILETNSEPSDNLADTIFISVVDDSGNEIKIEDLSDAAIVLLYAGEFNKIREIERTLKVKFDAKSHELASIAADFGYQNALDNNLPDMAGNGMFMIDPLLADFELIKEITGINPSHEVNDAVFLDIAECVEQEGFSKVVNAIEKYSRISEDVPSHNIVQNIYPYMCTNATDSSLGRVKKLYSIFEISPRIGQQELTPEDYVRAVKTQKYSELLTPHQKVYLTTMELSYLATNDKAEFLKRMQDFMASISDIEDYTISNVAKVRRFLSLAVRNDIAIPDSIEEMLPEVVSKSMVLKNMHRTRGIKEHFMYLRNRHLCHGDKATLTDAYAEGLRVLYEVFLPESWSKHKKGYRLKAPTMRRLSDLMEFAEQNKIIPNEKARLYISNIKKALSTGQYYKS